MRQPRPTDGLAHEQTPKRRPVDGPKSEPTQKERPVDGPKFEPTPRERPVDGRKFELMSWERPVDGLAYEPTPKKRPVDGPKSELMQRERLVDGPMFEPTTRERPVDGPKSELMQWERPVDGPKSDLMEKERPVDGPMFDPTPRERPVDGLKSDLMEKERPVDGPKFEPTSREGLVDGPKFEPTPRERPIDGPKSELMSWERPVDGPKSEPMLRNRPVETKTDPLIYIPPTADLPEWSDSEVMPLIIIDNSSVVEKPRTADGLLPVGSEILLPHSPEVNSFEDQEALSVPLSPNRVRKGHSQDMPAEGSIFLMYRRTYRDSTCDRPGAVNSGRRLHGPRRQTMSVSTTRSSEHQLRLLSATIPRGRIHRRLCQYITCRGTATLDSNINQSAVPTVFASGISPDSMPWSTAEDIIRDIVREGTFDAGATPMETEDSPLISTSIPGCPYQMTSYTGTAMVDADTTYGLQLHHPRFLEFIGAPESARLLNHSPSFWVDRLGQECAMAAAVNLQRDAGFMMSNLQILAQFVTSLHRMSSEMLSIGVDHVVFTVE